MGEQKNGNAAVEIPTLGLEAVDSSGYQYCYQMMYDLIWNFDYPDWMISEGLYNQ